MVFCCCGFFLGGGGGGGGSSLRAFNGFLIFQGGLFVGHFYIALFSALKQTHCTPM